MHDPVASIRTRKGAPFIPLLLRDEWESTSVDLEPVAARIGRFHRRIHGDLRRQARSRATKPGNLRTCSFARSAKRTRKQARSAANLLTPLPVHCPLIRMQQTVPIRRFVSLSFRRNFHPVMGVGGKTRTPTPTPAWFAPRSLLILGIQRFRFKCLQNRGCQVAFSSRKSHLARSSDVRT
jgi:hypothetical protein